MYAPGRGAVRTVQLPQRVQPQPHLQPQVQVDAPPVEPQPQVDVPATLPQPHLQPPHLQPPHLQPQELPLFEVEPLTLPPEQAEQSKQKQHLPEVLLPVLPLTLELCLQQGLQQD